MNFLMTGYPGWLTRRFLETLGNYPTPLHKVRCLVIPGQAVYRSYSINLECVEGNILRPEPLDRATEGMDTVLHAAGVLHVKKISDFYHINRDGTKNLLESCVRNGVKKLIYVSSNAAQGFCAGRGNELTEEGPCRPESHYGKSKYEGELAVQEFQALGKIETVIVRPAMFYGPPVPPRHIDIFRKVQKGVFPVFGSGDYLRSLTYIDNLIQGIHLAMTKSEAIGQTYYIADREVPTLLDIVRAVAEAMGREVKIIHFPRWIARAADKFDVFIAKGGVYWMLPHLVGESDKNIACRISKAERELGYAPEVNYREGYRRTIIWCQEQGLL